MTTTPPDDGERSYRHTNGARADDAEKLELLLETFLRADGDKWTLREIQEATGEVVSASYLSSIRARRIRQVGGRMREAMARVMNFPKELWETEPEEWSRVLAEKRTASDRGEAGASPLADLLEELFRRGRHPLTGSAFTARSVADLSAGALSEEEVLAIRRGEEADPPEAALLALSDVFGVPRSYWDGPREVPPLDEETAQFLAGPRRLRALHMRLVELPEDDRDEIEAVLEDLVDRARRGRLREQEGNHEPKKGGDRRTE